MDHLPWYTQSRVSPAKVPFVCGDEPVCQKEEFLSFPEKRGWQLEESESLAQLAKRAQSWLFFGLLAMIDISPDACVASDTSSTALQNIDTTPLLSARFGAERTLFYRESLDLTAEMRTSLDGTESDISSDTLDDPDSGVSEASAEADDAISRNISRKWELRKRDPGVTEASAEADDAISRNIFRKRELRKREPGMTEASAEADGATSSNIPNDLEPEVIEALAEADRATSSNIPKDLQPGVIEALAEATSSNIPNNLDPGVIKALAEADDDNSSDTFNDPNAGLIEAMARAEDYEEQQPLNLWNSASFAILFSIDVLMDTLARNITDQDCKKRRSEMRFPKRTKGVARSLLHVGKCRSLARRLDFNSSELYHLMSLPDGSTTEDHSICNETSCKHLNVNRDEYHIRHAAQHEDRFMCEDIGVRESELVRLIRRNEVPLVRSTMDSDGNIKIAITKMSMHVDYTAISHVWVGGLGNWDHNELPDCQLKAIHQDVCETMMYAHQDSIARLEDNAFYKDVLESKLFRNKRVVLFLDSRAPCNPEWYPDRTKPTTCHYWMDTLCIPANHAREKQLAMNAMARIYAGAANVLVLDPTLSSINYNDLGQDVRNERASILVATSPWMARSRRPKKASCKERANILVNASPWMARSWPLQEAALAQAIYLKFADRKWLYKHSSLGAAATLTSIPNQRENEKHLFWSSSLFTTDVLRKPRVLRPYEADSDFIQVWNLLSKRTTTEPQDVPAIFAALLHRSAGAVLNLERHLRTWAIIRSVECLPLDILLVKQRSQQDPSTTETPPWIPELPGSKDQVPLLSSRWGTLKRVASGFLVDLRNTDPKTTRAVVCPAGFVTSSTSLLRDVYSTKTFSIHIDRPQLGPKAKANDTGRESRLLLLLSKEHPQLPFMNHGVLCTIRSGVGDTLRVSIDSIIGWSAKTDHLPAENVVDCFDADASCSILIEMDFEHWPILTWSRFTAFPYQHLQALSFDFESIYCYTALMIWFVAVFVSALMTLVDGLPTLITMLHARRFLPGWYGRWLAAIVTTLAMPARLYIAWLEGRHAATRRARQARYIWANSFWDSEKTRKILSRSHWTISLIPFLIDMSWAAISTPMVAFFIRRGFASVDWFFTLGPWALEYYVRCLFHIFVQVQWFCSTLELREQRTWRLFSSLMSIHFLKVLVAIGTLMCAFGIAGATVIAVFGLRSIFSGRDDGDASWTDYPLGIIFMVSVPAGVGGSLFLFLVFCRLIWDTVADTFWRVKSTYSWRYWARRDSTTAPDREIQLV